MSTSSINPLSVSIKFILSFLGISGQSIKELLVNQFLNKLVLTIHKHYKVGEI